MDILRPVHRHTQTHLNQYLSKIEEILNADVLTIFSPIWSGLENIVKNAVELSQDRKDRIAVVLDTTGGYVEVVERMVYVIRKHYAEVYFLVPDRAMSAGTVFVMAGDQIFMSYSSCLGPIDPQIEKDGKFVPALSYLKQYEQLYEKAESGQLNTAELVLLNNLDPGELYHFQQLVKLSHDLLTEWLSTYKFKDWDIHSSTGNPVNPKEKRKRAEEIAEVLSNHERWRSHGRMISRDTLTSDSEGIHLKIEKIEDNSDLSIALDDYVGLLKDYMLREQLDLFIHTREYF